ncbi:MAG: alpha/beta fold hydrolase [Enterobacter hormaechei]
MRLTPSPAPHYCERRAGRYLYAHHHHQLLAAGNANVTRHMVEAGGHFIPLETPDEIAPLLRQWITECIQCAKTV